MSATKRAAAWKVAWAKKEAEGYQYGEDALEQVRFGFDLAYDAALADNAERVDQIKLEALEWRADRVKMIDALAEARATIESMKAAHAETLRRQDELAGIPG